MSPNEIVYVIDDDEAVRSSMEFLLRSAHMKVQCFEIRELVSCGIAGGKLRLHHYRRADAGDQRC